MELKRIDIVVKHDTTKTLAQVTTEARHKLNNLQEGYKDGNGNYYRALYADITYPPKGDVIRVASDTTVSEVGMLESKVLFDRDLTANTFNTNTEL